MATGVPTGAKLKSEILDKIEPERKLVAYINNIISLVITYSYLLRLASKAKEVFESSQPDK